MAEIGKDILHAASLLKEGELVAIPTETVYGLAGNALSENAVVKIFETKNRPQFDPLIVHVPTIKSITDYVEEIPEIAKLLADTFWPGPLTLVLKRKSIIPDLVTSGLNTVGIRCPQHELTLKLLEQLDFPLAAPSANPFGYVSPTTPHHVNDQLGNKIKYILDGGTCEVGLESTIIGFEGNKPVVYRLGGLSIEKIQAVIGEVKTNTLSTSNPKAPGQLISHYAPGKKVILGKIEDLLKQYPAHCPGILSFQKNYNSPYQVILSVNGNMEEAAKNLFAALRSFERMPVHTILAEVVPEKGLGRAINDRLKRASVVE